MARRFSASNRTTVLLLLAALVSGACGAARRRPPVAAAQAFSQQAEAGRIAFMAKCHRCHPGGEAGLAPALNDKPFPDFLKRFQVRHGLGVMPSFTKEELSDADLDAILEYLEELRDNPSRASRGKR